MKPLFLHHQALELLGVLAAGQPSSDMINVRRRLCTLRDQAISSGAHVLIVLWTLLAIQPPSDVVITDAQELIPNVMGNPEALEQMRQRAREGNHLQWLMLTRPNATKH